MSARERMTGKPASAWAAVLAATVAAAAWFPVPGAAAAERAPAHRVVLTLRYTCKFPYIGNQSAPVTVESQIPGSIPVGEPTARYPISAVATAPAGLATGLRAFGVSTLSGSANGDVTIAAPQGDIPAAVPFDVPTITLPAFDSFTVRGSGSAPEATFDQPGPGEIVVGDVRLHVVPRDSNGHLTSLGEFDVPCTLDPGQDKVAASFTITGGSPPAQPAAPATTLAPRPSPSASAPASKAAGLKGPSAAPSESAHAAASESPGGAAAAWWIWAVALAGLAVLGAAALRYLPRLRNR